MVSENVLEKVSTVAVTGSLGASALLGLFMLVQAALNRNHRWRYGLLGLLALSIAVTDGAHGLLAAKDYERLRLFEWSLYGPAVIFLFSQSSKRCLLLAALILFLGLATWNLGNPAYATTVVLTSSFAAAAFAHGRTYLATQGFASCVLAATSTCQAIACLFYIPVIALQNDFYTGLGYLHYSLITAYGVVFGWVNVPRELQGRSPVRIVGTHGALFFAAFCGAELLALPSFLLLESPIPAHFFR